MASWHNPQTPANGLHEGNARLAFNYRSSEHQLRRLSLLLLPSPSWNAVSEIAENAHIKIA